MHRPAFPEDAPAVGTVDARDALDEHRFAGARGPDEAKNFAAFEIEIDAVQNTARRQFDDQIPHSVKRERMERLVDAVQRIALERAQRFVGRELDVLVEGPSRTDPDKLRGRTRHNKTVNFTGVAQAGDFARVEITSATSTTLAGEESLLARLS